MPIPPRDRDAVRELARRVAEAAASPTETEKVRLWTACNDLRPIRPLVRLDPQNGWPELERSWLDPVCTDPGARGVERALALKLLRLDALPDDVPITDLLSVPAVIRGAGYDDYGLAVEVERARQTDGAYHIVRLLRGPEDLLRLHPRPITVDHAATELEVERVHDLVGDLVRVVPRGKTAWRYGLTRVLVHWRGLDQMMLDLYDDPVLLHKLMAFLRDDFLAEIDRLESEDAVSRNTTPDDVTGSGGLTPCSALAAGDGGGPARVRECVCWAESQETVGVGPAQFDEFVLAYQLPLMARFGLTDYGCCEPLDRKLDLLISKVPNLRWVSVSPWADRVLAAEKLGGRYVYVYKPNPAYLCSPRPAWEDALADIRATLSAARGQPLAIVMKDTSTFHGDPDRATRWCEAARRLAVESV